MEKSKLGGPNAAPDARLEGRFTQDQIQCAAELVKMANSSEVHRLTDLAARVAGLRGDSAVDFARAIERELRNLKGKSE